FLVIRQRHGTDDVAERDGADDLVLADINNGYFLGVAHGSQIHPFPVRGTERVVRAAPGEDAFDDLRGGQVNRLVVAVVDGHVGELAVRRDGELVRLGADGHAARHLVRLRVDPDQFAGLALAVTLDGDEYDVLGR